MRKVNITIGLLLIASLSANLWLWIEANRPADVKVETHTEYVMIKDTTPVMAESYLTGETLTVTAAVHHAMNHEPDKPETEIDPDTTATVSIVGDSATVTLPIEQRVYQDSLYTAYVSGYRPRLDSIELRMPHTYTTVKKTVSKPSRRFAFGPTAGAGYGITCKQFDLFVGVSATWNILP